MEKLKSISGLSWRGYEIEGEKSLSQIKGGATLLNKQTTTKDATYIAAPGGGSFDNGSEDSQHESM